MANEGPHAECGPEATSEKTPDGRARRIAAAAERALAEAAERRADVERAAQVRAAELGGRDGPEPTRYGDWEKKGIAIDF